MAGTEWLFDTSSVTGIGEGCPFPCRAKQEHHTELYCFDLEYSGQHCLKHQGRDLQVVLGVQSEC